MAGVEVSAQLNSINSQLKGTDKAFKAAIKKELRAAINDGGSGVLAAVKERASWSTRIPGATKISTRFGASSASAKVVVNSKKAPHARPFENGNKNGGSTLRHPVFGHGMATGADEPTRPFFFPAVFSKDSAIEDRMSEAMDEIARSAGFK